MARLGTTPPPPFDTQDPPEKNDVGPFLRPFPGNEAQKFFWWPEMHP